jgi:hypothetical protein
MMSRAQEIDDLVLTVAHQISFPSSLGGTRPSAPYRNLTRIRELIGEAKKTHEERVGNLKRLWAREKDRMDACDAFSSVTEDMISEERVALLREVFAALGLEVPK